MTPPNYRRWFRFSLRTMFVLVTLMGLLLSWLSYAIAWDRQRQAMLEEFTGWGDTWPPLPLLILCKPGVENLTLDIDRDEMTLVDDAQRLFPESNVDVGCSGRRK